MNGVSMDMKCASCGSKRVLRGGQVVSRAFFGPAVASVEVTPGPRGRMRSSISAAVCVDCGNIAFGVVDLTKLRRAYEEVAKPLGLET